MENRHRLLNTNGAERPSLTWLKNYVASNKNPPNDFPNFLNHTTGTISPNVVAIPHGPSPQKLTGLMEYLISRKNDQILLCQRPD